MTTPHDPGEPETCCDECGADVPTVGFGDPDDDGLITIHLCAGCLRAGLELLEE